MFTAVTGPVTPTLLLDDPDVVKALGRVARRVRKAGLRLSPPMRLVGSAAALTAPTVALIGVAYGADLGAGITVGVLSAVMAPWTLSLRGLTVAGWRTLRATGDRSVANSLTY